MTGGVLAGAVEPAAGSDGHTHEQACLNCGTTLIGSHCHRCGQAAHVHRTLSAFFHDLLHGVFHFEGKIWRTIPLLAWKPGELTRRYIDGQRASFVSPIALFLFFVFLMFATVSSLAHFSTTDQVKRGMLEDAAKTERQIADTQKERAAAIAAHRPTAAIDARIKELEGDARLSRSIGEKGVVAGAATRAADDVPEFLREPLAKVSDNPALFFYKLKSSAYKYSWALIPISVPFLWLLFPFSRRFRLYDHTVFVTYSLCFMSLLATLATLWNASGIGGAGLLVFAPPVHMYRQLRGAYSLGWFGALWRTAVLTVVAGMAMVLFVVALVGLGLFD
ncbi:DUF3667 domain-containing protein [Sphingomonas ginkgonis]|uniref:DUF3667 domain-containing protein n=2 Tax=Sphingomonas ginkgonis TaxID=2315330 RepID=A0A3R9Y814_9SPHN|nr:DUF3667 domain-containing protein [Sphingomonas ginkgonis]